MKVTDFTNRYVTKQPMIA